MKKLRLHKSALSNDAITTIAATTLNNGGFVVPDASTEPPVGGVMKDRTIYAGTSPATGRDMYAAPADAPLTMTFNEASGYAKKLNADKHLGHNDWRVPSEGELNVLFENRNCGSLNGTFNETGALPGGWYWSSTPRDYANAAMQRFNRGCQLVLNKLTALSLRCVRG